MTGQPGWMRVVTSALLDDPVSAKQQARNNPVLACPARPYSQQRRPVFSTTPKSQSTPLSIIAALVATARI